MAGKLFLICPTDFIELPIRKEFKSECFFYTALGLNFHWDNYCIGEILHLLDRYAINDIVFVSNFRNKFYLDSLNEEKALKSSPSVLELYETLKSVEPKIYFNTCNDEKMKVLASKHLFEQERKLKQKLALKHHYKVSSVLFDKEISTFLAPNYFSFSFDSQLN